MRGKTHCVIGILTTIQACILLKLPINLFTILLSGLMSLLPDLDEPNSTISNLFVKKKITKFLFKLLIFIINISIFFVSISINDNFYISSIITFISITIIESKLAYANLRKTLLSFMFLLLATCLYIANLNIYVVVFIALLSIFPWLKHRGFSHSILAILIINFFLKQIELIYNISNLALLGTISYASHMFLGDLFTKAGIPLFYPISRKKFSLSNSRVGSISGNRFEILVVLMLIILIIFTLYNL